MKEEAMIRVVLVESPPTNELLDTYVDNCHTIERAAVDLLAASEISVFNGLRNLSSQECLKVLDRINSKYVSDGEFVDYFVSLAVMTEYICTAYRNPHLYDTFLVALGSKSTELLFNKLCQRWMQVYRNHNLSNHIDGKHFVSCFNVLKYSVNQFPTSFVFKEKLRDTICVGEEVLRQLEERNSLVNRGSMVKTKLREWVFDREVPQSPATNAGMTTVKKNLEMKIPAKNPETNVSLSKPEMKTKSNGWIFEREVLQSPTVNTGTTTVMTNYQMKNLETNTSISSLVTKPKPKSKGWMFERVVLKTPLRNINQSVGKVTKSTVKPTQVRNTIETVDLTMGESAKVSTMSAANETRVLQKSILVSLDVINVNGSVGSSEPPKKKIRNAFDVLMRRDEKKIISNTSVRVA